MMPAFGAKEQNVLLKVWEAKEGGVSASWRKCPVLDTDSIDTSICKVIRG